jgi:hypothetical protein
MDQLVCQCGETTSNYFNYNMKGVVVHDCIDPPYIVRATPDAVFDNDLLRIVHAGLYTYCRLETTCCADISDHPVGQPCFVGALLHFDADRHLVYRIIKYSWLENRWEGRWPD